MAEGNQVNSISLEEVALLLVGDGYFPYHYEDLTKLNSVVLVRKRTIPTERPQPVGEVSANFIIMKI
jgi:hypothetical protein